MQQYQYHSDRFQRWMERECKRPLTLSIQDWQYIAVLILLVPLSFGLGLLIGLLVIIAI